MRIVLAASNSSARTAAAPRLWRTGAGAADEPRNERWEDPWRKDRLEIFERGTAQVHVGGVERQRRDVYRLALKHESQEIEDVLAGGAIIDDARELAFDRRIDGGRRLRQLGMAVGQGQKRPSAAEANLEGGRGKRLDKAIACEDRRAVIQHKGQPAANDVRRRGVEQCVDELAGGARTKPRQGLDDVVENGPVREQWNYRSDP